MQLPPFLRYRFCAMLYRFTDKWKHEDPGILLQNATLMTNSGINSIYYIPSYKIDSAAVLQTEYVRLMCLERNMFG